MFLSSLLTPTHGLRLIDRVTSNRNSYRAFLRHRDEDARRFADLLQQDLRSHTFMDRNDRANAMAALLRLSRKSKLLPSSFYLGIIQNVQRVTELETSSTDIFQGVYQGGKVFLKRYRFYGGTFTHEDREELLSREAILWANHQHTNILPFVGVFQREDAFESGLYLVSPWLDNGTVVGYLKARPHSNRPLLMRGVLDAIAYLHSNDVVHGDLKGANILVDASGHACLADLGFSRLTDAAILTWTTIQSTASIGTVPWQAPELLEAHSIDRPFKPTAAADVYSLGCVAYEIFCNHPPFYDKHPGSPMRPLYILVAVVEGGERPTKPDSDSEAYTLCGLTEEVWTAMELCWIGEPQLRPSALELSKLPCFSDVPDVRS